ncbi:MAG TPA: right-handed parallel beta-helix repeat-containing protein [Nitrososphaeraceae archaeon]|nr:right-handed parallel beta-helix repeat-containing protein [Nitrososphaeraceae archaeon]
MTASEKEVNEQRGIDNVCLKYDNITKTIIVCDNNVEIPTIFSFFNNSNILESIGNKEWLLRSNILVLENGTLIIDGSKSKVIKIDSNYSSNIPYSITSRGNLIIDNTRITSWNSTSDSQPVVSSPETVRPYILTFWDSFGNTNITNSYLENLGYKGYVGTEGITYFSGKGSLISNNTISGNYLGLHLMNNVSDIAIENNDISKSNFEGIKLDTKTNNIKVFDNTIHENNLHAIACLRGCNLVDIKNNVLENNIGIGILVDKQAKKVIIENNKIKSNTMGIMIAESEDNSINNNIIDKNGNGIFLKKSASNLITKNNITGSNNYGINIYSNSSLNTIKNNIIQKSMNSGINMADYGTKNNKFVENVIEGGLNHGIRLDRTFKNNFESNVVDKNKNVDYYIKLSKDSILMNTYFNNTSILFFDKKSNLKIVNMDNKLLDGNNVTNIAFTHNNTVIMLPIKNFTKLTTIDMYVVPNLSYVNISSINNDFSKNKDYKKWNAAFAEPKMQTKFIVEGFNSGSQFLLKTNETVSELVSVDKRNNIQFSFVNDGLSYIFKIEATKTPMLITILILSILIGLSAGIFFLLRRKRMIKDNNIKR